MVLLFAYTFLISLAKGGRWDLYQPLAMSDVGIEYWEPGIQGLASSTPYFPGVAFFLSSLAAVGLPSEESALALAAIVTALVPLSLGYIGRRLGVTMEVGYQTVIYSGFAAIFLNPWIGYSGEFKPDFKKPTIGLDCHCADYFVTSNEAANSSSSPRSFFGIFGS
jgi:hypothetical protein